MQCQRAKTLCGGIKKSGKNKRKCLANRFVEKPCQCHPRKKKSDKCTETRFLQALGVTKVQAPDPHLDGESTRFGFSAAFSGLDVASGRPGEERLRRRRVLCTNLTRSGRRLRTNKWSSSLRATAVPIWTASDTARQLTERPSQSGRWAARPRTYFENPQVAPSLRGRNFKKSRLSMLRRATTAS